MPGVLATVLADGEPTCDATVTAVGEGVDVALTIAPSAERECAYRGLFNSRGGHYRISASLPGHSDASGDIEVGFDGCFPVTANVTLSLAPLANPSDGGIDAAAGDADDSP